MDSSAVFLYVLAVVAYTASPGPMIAILLSRSIGATSKDAIAMAFGFCLSRLIVVVSMASGSGVWLAKNPDLLVLGKALGAAYLAWLAIGLWVGGSNKLGIDPEQNPWLVSVGAGVAIGLGNPATFLIYVVLLQVLAPTGFTHLSHIVVACLITFLSVAAVYLGTIFFAQRLRTIVATPLTSLLMGRIAATALAVTSMWMITA
jgi:threonine/homoserine/homoserine lactone efflux protein